MKKSVLTNGVAGFTDGGAATAGEFRDYETNNVSNSYADIRYDSDITEAYTTNISSGYAYYLEIVKQGRRVTLTGWLRNETSISIPGGQKVFSINDLIDGEPSDLIPNDTDDPITTPLGNLPFQYESFATTQSGTSVRIAVTKGLTGNGLYVLDVWPPNMSIVQRYKFTLTYFVKE